MPLKGALMHLWEAFVPHVMAFMPLRDVIVAFRVKFTNIVPHKIFCASPPGGQEATLSDTLPTALRIF